MFWTILMKLNWLMGWITSNMLSNSCHIYFIMNSLREVWGRRKAICLDTRISQLGDNMWWKRSIATLLEVDSMSSGQLLITCPSVSDSSFPAEGSSRNWAFPQNTNSIVSSTHTKEDNRSTFFSLHGHGYKSSWSLAEFFLEQL